MNDFESFMWSMAFLVIGLVCGGASFYSFGTKNMQQEAVDEGFAEWIVKEGSNHTEFTWNKE